MRTSLSLRTPVQDLRKISAFQNTGISGLIDINLHIVKSRDFNWLTFAWVFDVTRSETGVAPLFTIP